MIHRRETPSFQVTAILFSLALSAPMQPRAAQVLLDAEPYQPFAARERSTSSRRDQRATEESEEAEEIRIKGTVELGYGLQQNFDLDPDFGDDRQIWEARASFAAEAEINDWIETSLELVFSRDFILEDEAKTEDTDSLLTIETAYVHFDEPVDNLSIRIGRQDFLDNNAWLYDADLDAVRLFYGISNFRFELSASREGVFDDDILNRGSTSRLDNINNYILSIEHQAAENVTNSAYVIVRDDREPNGVDEIFLGFRSRVGDGPGLNYRLDVGHVRGSAESEDIRGFGFDVGATYAFSAPLSPYITVGSAFGSGDSDLDDDTDEEFRQTGLQSNQDSFGGATTFRYYGEVFDPELSNMWIFTAGLGLKLAQATSIDLIYHRYWQVEVSDVLTDTGIGEDPDGLNKSLGTEIDLVFASEFGDWLIEAFLGYFEPGDAFFPEADSAFSANIILTYYPF